MDNDTKGMYMKYSIDTSINQLPLQFYYYGYLCVKWYDGNWHVLESGTNPENGKTIKLLVKQQVVNYLNSIENERTN